MLKIYNQKTYIEELQKMQYQTIICKVLHRKQKIEQHTPTNMGVDLGAHGG